MTPYQVQPLWAGETAVLAASGPSLTIDQLEYVRGRARLLAISDTYRLAPWADAHYFCDRRWWDWHGQTEGYRNGTFERYTQAEDAAVLAAGLRPPCVIRYVKNGGTEGLEDRRDYIRTGYGSGYQALNLALHLGPRRIVLIGYDMTLGPAGREHWFGAHPGNNPLREGTLKLMREAFDKIAHLIEARQVEVINATRGGKLEAFPRMTLEQALSGAPALTNNSPERREILRSIDEVKPVSPLAPLAPPPPRPLVAVDWRGTVDSGGGPVPVEWVRWLAGTGRVDVWAFGGQGLAAAAGIPGAEELRQRIGMTPKSGPSVPEAQRQGAEEVRVKRLSLLERLHPRAEPRIAVTPLGYVERPGWRVMSPQEFVAYWPELRTLAQR